MEFYHSKPSQEVQLRIIRHFRHATTVCLPIEGQKLTQSIRDERVQNVQPANDDRYQIELVQRMKQSEDEGHTSKDSCAGIARGLQCCGREFVASCIT